MSASNALIAFPTCVLMSYFVFHFSKFHFFRTRVTSLCYYTAHDLCMQLFLYLLSSYNVTLNYDILLLSFRHTRILHIQYSLQQKHCTTALDEKSSVFLTVNICEKLFASTYTKYKYIPKLKKIAADGNPDV